MIKHLDLCEFLEPHTSWRWTIEVIGGRQWW